MKNLATSLFIALFVILSCEKKSAEISTRNNAANGSEKTASDRFATDSVWVDDSLKINKNLTAGFRNKVLIFNGINDKIVLDSIYSPRNIKLANYTKEDLAIALNKQKDEFYNGTKESLADWSPDFAQTWEQNSDMKIYSTQDDFLTIQYLNDGYTGGAHGYYNEIYKVFDLKTNRTLQLSDVIKNQDAKIWSKILMNHFLKNDLGKGQAEMLLVENIPLNDNFYFDGNNLYFLYNQYEITAYAAGPVLIKIPFSEVKPLLNNDFKKSLKL